MPILCLFTPWLKSTGNIVAIPGKPERADHMSPFPIFIFKSIGNVVGTNCIDYAVSKGRPHALEITFRPYGRRYLAYQIPKIRGMCQVMRAGFNVIIGLAFLPLPEYRVKSSG